MFFGANTTQPIQTKNRKDAARGQAAGSVVQTLALIVYCFAPLSAVSKEKPFG